MGTLLVSIEMVGGKDEMIVQLEQELSCEVERRESVERQLQKQVEKGKSRSRTRELEQENEELRKSLRQK